MINVSRPVPEREGVDRRMFEGEIAPAGLPIVMRGLVADWPIIATANQSTQALAAHLRTLDSGAPVGVMRRRGGDGFYFYQPDMDGFNFERLDAKLGQVIDALLAAPGHPKPVHLYAGPALAEEATQKFAAANPMPLLDPKVKPRLWLSNASRVAAHYDVSRNIACVVAGTRRFILFPPEQVANLYMGPFEHTMAGPSVSMVDFHAPDHARFPRFAQAEAAAMVADLEPGDAIYLPTLWWHHVESFGTFNLLVNHWWKTEHAGPDFEALLTAMLGVRDQPAPERTAWRAFFEHFVFADDAPKAGDHLPERWRTTTGKPGPERDRMMLRFVMGQLSEKAR